MSSNKDKQKLLALYLSKGLSERESAIKAGYSEKTVNANLRGIIKNTLKKYDVRKVIDEELQKGNTELLNNSKVLQPKDLLTWWSELIISPDTKLEHKIKVSELLAKCHGMLLNRVEVTQINYSDVVSLARQRLENVGHSVVTVDNQEPISLDNTSSIAN